MEINISFLIQLLSYILLFGACLKYLSGTLAPSRKIYDETHIKRQSAQIIELRKEIDNINERFAVNFDSARRGNLKKRRHLI